jgi:glycosyltransferase involved in cell wall biosynthesis
MIAPTPFFADRGCHVRIYEETRALKSLGYNVIICSYHIGRDIDGIKVERIVNIPWYKKLSAGPSYHKFYLDILLFIKSLKVAIRTRPDIIHAHLHEGALIGALINKLLGIPFIADFQGGMVDEILAHNFVKKGDLAYKFFLYMESIIDNLPAKIIISSNEGARILTERFNIPEERIHVIKDGVDISVFNNGIEINKLRKKLRIIDGRKVVVFVGVFTVYQGIDIILNIIPDVVKRVKNVHFLMMGYPDEDLYREKINSMGYEEYVTFTGRINYFELPTYLSIGDVAISPKLSTTEANGKLYTYMAAGLPAVVFDTPVNREILGDLGVYAKPTDSDSFKEKLIEVLLNEDLRKELGKRMRNKAIKEYSWNNNVNKIIEIYKEVNKR